MNFTLIVIIIIAILYLTYYIYNKVYTPWSRGLNYLTETENSLSETKIYNFIPAINKTNNYTFAFYVYPDISNRTTKLNSPLGNAMQIFSWDGLFYFTHDAMKDASILYVNKAGNNNPNDLLPIHCPALPQQKWTYVAIVIDGRRFSVLYNGRVVASRLLDGMPNMTMSGKLSSGFKDLRGKIALVGYNDYSMNADQLAIEYTSTSDTRGKPYVNTTGSLLSIFQCPAGIFCLKPSTPPSRAILSWETPFN